MELTALMQRVHQGDKEAFKAIYAKYNEVVYRIAFDQVRDQQAALGIVKVVFQTVYQTLTERGPIEGDFYAWLDALTAKELRHLAQQRPQPPTQVPMAQPPVFQARPMAAVPAAPRKIQPQPAAQIHSAPQRTSEAIPPLPPRQRAYPQPTAEQPQIYTPSQPRQTPVRRYTPEEAQAIEARARARLEGLEQEEEEQVGSGALTTLGIIGGIGLCLLLGWTLCGLLMRLGVLPNLDLGYAWFNETLFPLF